MGLSGSRAPLPMLLKFRGTPEMRPDRHALLPRRTECQLPKAPSSSWLWPQTTRTIAFGHKSAGFYTRAKTSKANCDRHGFPRAELQTSAQCQMWRLVCAILTQTNRTGPEVAAEREFVMMLHGLRRKYHSFSQLS